MAWVTIEDVAAVLGSSVNPTDTEFLQACTDAANAYAYRRRVEAGYNDDPDLTPGPDASMGTVMYAVALFRERGSVDSYSSFEEFSVGVPSQSTFGQVNRLLGVPRPAVG